MKPSSPPGITTTSAGDARFRGVCLLLGAVIACAALTQLYTQRRDAQAIGTHEQSRPRVAFFGQTRLNVWQPDEYSQVYLAEQDDPAENEALWLGNSQLHTINQPAGNDAVAPRHASDILGYRVYGLSLNNASVQEQLVVLHWALSRRKSNWLILAVCYDDLREDNLRCELVDIVTPQVSESLAGSTVGRRLADQITAARQVLSDVQGTSRAGRSWQDVSERKLESTLQTHWDTWVRRPDMLGTVKYKLYELRNATFGIEASSKRRMIPLRKQKNMAALAEMLRVAQEHGMKVLLYNVPLRWDVEPPYDLDAYRNWQRELADVVKCNGAAIFLDLDELVPANLWGLHHGRNVDFMHFEAQGHRMLGQRIAETIRAAATPEGGR